MGYKVNISKETPKMPKSCSKNGQKIGFSEQNQISGLYDLRIHVFICWGRGVDFPFLFTQAVSILTNTVPSLGVSFVLM